MPSFGLQTAKWQNLEHSVVPLIIEYFRIYKVTYNDDEWNWILSNFYSDKKDETNLIAHFSDVFAMQKPELKEKCLKDIFKIRQSIVGSVAGTFD